MAKELIHVVDSRGRLHCDNSECGHVLPEGTAVWGAHLIGYQCPKCGHDMLTLADYAASERLHRTVTWLNKWFGWLGREYDPVDPYWASEVSIRHHDGKIIVENEKDT